MGHLECKSSLDEETRVESGSQGATKQTWPTSARLNKKESEIDAPFLCVALNLLPSWSTKTTPLCYIANGKIKGGEEAHQAKSWIWQKLKQTIFDSGGTHQQVIDGGWIEYKFLIRENRASGIPTISEFAAKKDDRGAGEDCCPDPGIRPKITSYSPSRARLCATEDKT